MDHCSRAHKSSMSLQVLSDVVICILNELTLEIGNNIQELSIEVNRDWSFALLDELILNA